MDDDDWAEGSAGGSDDIWTEPEGKRDWPGNDVKFGWVGEGGEVFDMAQKGDGLGIQIKRPRSKHQRPKDPVTTEST